MVVSKFLCYFLLDKNSFHCQWKGPKLGEGGTLLYHSFSKFFKLFVFILFLPSITKIYTPGSNGKSSTQESRSGSKYLSPAARAALEVSLTPSILTVCKRKGVEKT